MLNKKQIHELLKAVDFFHVLFIGNNIGVEWLTQEDYDILKTFNIDLTKLTQKQLIKHAFTFGMLSTALKQQQVTSMSFNELKRFVANGTFLPLTEGQKHAISIIEQQAYGDVKGLANKVKQGVNQIIINHSKKQQLATVKQLNQLTETALKEKMNIQQFSSLLGEKTKDWARDFDRISDYVMHSAFQQGRAFELLQDYGDKVEVFYTVYDGACPHCIRTYLTNGIGSEPIVFLLTDLLKNGSNIGRKPQNYLPSVDPLHPWCRCTLSRKPENSIWDATNKRFVLTRNTYGVNRKSKVKVTVKLK